MAAAIISGLVSKGFDKQKIHVSEPWDVNRNKMADLGVKTTTSNLEAASGADVLIIAVKPQVAKTVCQELAGAWSSSSSSSDAAAALPLLVSIAAGITSDSLRGWSTTSAGRAPPVVRVMPNTPALVGEGASGLYAAGDVSAEQRELVSALMSSVSKATEWVDREELLDVVTGLSGKETTPTRPCHSLALNRLWLDCSVHVLTPVDPTRFRPGVLLRHRGAPGRERDAPRPPRGAGDAAGQADVLRRRQDHARVGRDARPAAQERHQPQWHHPGRARELRGVGPGGHRRRRGGGGHQEGRGAREDARPALAGPPGSFFRSPSFRHLARAGLVLLLLACGR